MVILDYLRRIISHCSRITRILIAVSFLRGFYLLSFLLTEADTEEEVCEDERKEEESEAKGGRF